MTRRLPVYVVADETVLGPASRLGSHVPALKQSWARIRTAKGAVVQFVFFGQRAYIALGPGDGRFAAEQRRGSEIVAAEDGAGSCLGAALRILCKSLQTETDMCAESRPKEYRALVFVLASRIPDDPWEMPAYALRMGAQLGLVNVFGFALEPAAEPVLQQFASAVFAVRHGLGGLADCLQWISEVVETTTRLAPRASATGKLVKAPWPAHGLTLVGPGP